ncbi:MAG: hypothetical protein GY851_15565 [bacterium]|nr:hypothetical protein [bacterium]
MSDAQMDDTCQNIEAAIIASETQSQNVQEGLAERMDKLRSTLNDISDFLSEQRRAQAGQYDALRHETASLATALEEHQTHAGKEQDEIAQLQALVRQHEEDAQTAKERLAQMEKTRAEQTDADQAARRRIADLETQLKEQETDQHAVGKRVEELENAERDLRARLDDAAAKEQALTAEHATAQARMAVVLGELDTLKPLASQSEALQSELDTERARLAELESKYEREIAKGTKAVIAQQLAEALQDLENANAELASLRTGNADSATEAPESAESPSGDETVIMSTLNLDADDETEAPDVELPELQPDETGEEAPPKPKREPHGPSLGDILLERGAISADQLDLASQQQREARNISLGEILVEQGLVEPEVVAQALAAQQGVEFVRLDPQAIDREAAFLVSGRIAQNHSCIPIAASDDSVTLAMVDPLNLIAIEDVERATGRTIEPVVATLKDVASAIKVVYEEP